MRTVLMLVLCTITQLSGAQEDGYFDEVARFKPLAAGTASISWGEDYYLVVGNLQARDLDFTQSAQGLKLLVTPGRTRFDRVFHPARDRNGRAAPLTDVTAVSFSPEGDIVALGSNDGTVRLWVMGKLLKAYEVDSSARPLPDAEYSLQNTCTDLAWSPDGTLLAMMTPSLGVTLSEVLRNGEDELRCEPYAVLKQSLPIAMDWSREPGGALVVSDSRGGVRLWDVPKLRENQKRPIILSEEHCKQGIRYHLKQPASVATSSEGRYLVVAVDNELEINDCRDGRVLRLEGAESTIGVMCVRRHPFQVIGSSRPVIREGRRSCFLYAWNSRGELIGKLETNAEVTAIECSADGKYLAALESNGVVRAFRLN